MFLLLFGAPVACPAVDTLFLSLPACHDFALSRGATAKADEQGRLAAEYNRKAALAAMFPRLSANGGYLWNSRKLHLLADHTDFSYGSASVAPDGSASWTWNSGAQGVISDAAGQFVADAYKAVYDKLTIDLTHIVVAQVGLFQPIYTGGRLTQLYRIAKASENIAAAKASANASATLYAVDEAYWRVVSVARKKNLAYEYQHLLAVLERDVQEAVGAGLATQSDLLQVAAKRGDADVKVLQAENGLTLANMALAQLCGLPLSAHLILDESTLAETTFAPSDIDPSAAVANRSEMRIMEETRKIAESTAKLASAGLQPNIVAQAGYIYTNPNAENGVSNKWDGKGYFSAGVVVNVPIVHADDILRYKAAKHAAKAVELKTEQTRELLTLQTTQANQKMAEAQQKIALAQLSRKNAAELLRLADESFQAGMITASELMQTQTQWLAAETELVDALVEAKTLETQLRIYLGQ